MCFEYYTYHLNNIETISNALVENVSHIKCKKITAITRTILNDILLSLNRIIRNLRSLAIALRSRIACPEAIVVTEGDLQLLDISYLHWQSVAIGMLSLILQRM